MVDFQDKRPYRTLQNVKNCHWRMPTIVLSCFFGGCILAILHHVLNSLLDGTAIADNVLSQQWIIRANNAIALMVKFLLVLATSIAYVQMMWKEVRTGPVEIARLDAMFAVLSTAFELWDLRFWLTHPLLSLPMAVAWYVCCRKRFAWLTVKDPPPDCGHHPRDTICCFC